jgi:type IV pilus assembly protein PilB
MSSQLQPSLVGLSGMARRLVAEEVLPEDEVRKAIAETGLKKATLTSWLLDHTQVDSAALTRIASIEFGMPRIDVASLNPKTMPLNLISEALISKHQVLPLFLRGKRLFVGIADPMQSHALDEVKFHSNCMVEPILVERASLRRTIETVLNGMRDVMPEMGGDLDELDIEGGDAEVESTGIDASGTDDAPVVKFVNKILVDAIRRGASDIHFEPFETQYRVRLRLDGMLKSVASPPLKMANRISSRLKVMAQLDIAEKRVPQDGRIKLNLSKTRAIDFRVSSLPTLFGEKIVLRILDGSSAKIGIEKLGYEPEQQKLYLDAIAKPYGMVLVTGPTGSGKTVSLYTCLNLLNKPGVNICTAEDPSEINMPGVNQVNVNEKAGLTFAAALKSFLRQDPDVIMVGEIRDLETADIAIKAAQTGHLVLSTLHTNDAPTTLTRMRNMGIAPFNIASSVILITAQRLARRLCPNCKAPADIPHETLLDAGFTEEDVDGTWTPYRPVGCSACNNGYKGRVGIYQVMPITEDIQRIILADGSALEIAKQAESEGVRSLRQSGLHKVKLGVTSLEEVLGCTNV